MKICYAAAVVSHRRVEHASKWAISRHFDDAQAPHSRPTAARRPLRGPVS